MLLLYRSSSHRHTKPSLFNATTKRFVYNPSPHPGTKRLQERRLAWLWLCLSRQYCSKKPPSSCSKDHSQVFVNFMSRNFTETLSSILHYLSLNLEQHYIILSRFCSASIFKYMLSKTIFRALISRCCSEALSKQYVTFQVIKFDTITVWRKTFLTTKGQLLNRFYFLISSILFIACNAKGQCLVWALFAFTWLYLNIVT